MTYGIRKKGYMEKYLKYRARKSPFAKIEPLDVIDRSTTELLSDIAELHGDGTDVVWYQFEHHVNDSMWQLLVPFAAEPRCPH